MVTFPASLATNLYSCGTGPAWGQDVAAALGLGYSLQVPGGQQGQSGHVLPGTGFTACVPGSGTHLDGQAQLGATGCMSPNCCIHGVTPVPGAGSSKGGTRTGGPRGFVLQPLGAWLWTRRFLLKHMCVLPSPPTPRSPGLLSALLECRRHGCGGQPGAWHLVIKSSGVDCSWWLQDGCGFEGAAPRGLGQPPMGSAAQASASPSWPLCHSILRSEGFPGENPPPFSGGEGIVKCDCRDLPEWTVQTWVWPGKGRAGDTWQVHWGSASPDAEQLGPGRPRPGV